LAQQIDFAMFLRALFAFIALPGLVAFVIPAWWLNQLGHEQIVQPLGFLPFLLGVVGLLWCVRDFYVDGKGTLAPWSPQKNLVVVGLYRYSRNPMYVSVALILIGWTIAFASRNLATYTIIVLIAFHLRVVFGEEPWLKRTHGAEWDEYAKKVPRWFF
jgi:protein-S-isoprenylcysteine O-methyltransferase Ste14